MLPISKAFSLYLLNCCLFVALQTSASLAQDVGSATAASVLNGRIEELAKAHQGDVAVAYKHLTKGDSFQLNGSRPQGTASLIKLPVMIEAYRQANEGKLRLYKQVELREEDKVQGSGILTTHFSAGTKLSVRDAIRLMIAYSDNTATNLVLDQITLPATGQTMGEWGYPETRIHAKVFKRETSIAPERSDRFGLGSTTANDMLDLLDKMHAGKLISPAMSKEMLEHLAACEDKVKFSALLPKGTKIAQKTGSVAKIRTGAGIIETPTGPVALCVLTENNVDTSWSDTNAGDRLCAEIAKVVYDYYSQDATAKPSTADADAPLAKGATGQTVEALQRTLNARAEPSPNLSVDGDFGSGTEAAVKAFQRSKQLPDTGQVDRATWDALGPLVMEEAPVPDPDVVNAETLAKQPADDPLGPPAVTCKAWTIVDASSGEVIAGQRNDQSLDIASTTKIMTAYLVIQYCQEHPEALRESLVFSERADKTVGSTAGVRTGETVIVEDLLYGLLLPSGNDASVALGEHFGERLGTEKDADQPAYDRFVSAMNRAAESLKLSNTHFVNTHGLTAPGHQSSCNDLARLAIAARALPLFVKVTNCRQYGCRVTGPGGYQRNIKWENTNQLLATEGYTGVKTGTTDAAGACLVSAGACQDREIIVVVLGAANSSARYVDTRNLFAWARRNAVNSQAGASK